MIVLRRESPGVLRAFWLLVAATMVATWGLTPDFSEQGGYMRILPALPLSTGVERVIGILAVAVAIASAVALILAFVSRALSILWLAPLSLLLPSSVLIGAGVRVLQAETDGANIGGGLLIVMGGPVLLVMLAAGVGLTIILLKTRNASRPLN